MIWKWAEKCNVGGEMGATRGRGRVWVDGGKRDSCPDIRGSKGCWSFE